MDYSNKFSAAAVLTPHHVLTMETLLFKEDPL